MDDTSSTSLTYAEAIDVAERAVIGLRLVPLSTLRTGFAMHHSDAQSLMAVIHALATTVAVMADQFKMSNADVSVMFAGMRAAERASRE